MAQKQATYQTELVPGTLAAPLVAVNQQGIITAINNTNVTEFGKFLAFRGKFVTFSPTVGIRNIFNTEVLQSGFLTNLSVDGLYTVPANGGGRYYVSVFQQNFDFGGSGIYVNGVLTLGVNNLTAQVNITSCQGFLNLLPGDTVQYQTAFGNATVPTIQLVFYSCF